MKYCIGCEHLSYSEPDPGTYSDTSGIMFAEDAALACRLGHWRHEFNRWGAGLENFERAMMQAETCSDFKERAASQSTGDT